MIAYQQRCQARVDDCLNTLFVPPRPQLERLYQAMRYSVMNGGKRVRPLLVYAACEALEGDAAQADGAACAVELIHAYSLVHDDLPAMDDDDLRRGQPTTHKAFDEACAILLAQTRPAADLQCRFWLGEATMTVAVSRAVSAKAVTAVGPPMAANIRLAAVLSLCCSAAVAIRVSRR